MRIDKFNLNGLGTAADEASTKKAAAAKAAKAAKAAAAAKLADKNKADQLVATNNATASSLSSELSTINSKIASAKSTMTATVADIARIEQAIAKNKSEAATKSASIEKAKVAKQIIDNAVAQFAATSKLSDEVQGFNKSNVKNPAFANLVSRLNASVIASFNAAKSAESAARAQGLTDTADDMNSRASAYSIMAAKLNAASRGKSI
jgi:hypothetical protein